MARQRACGAAVREPRRSPRPASFHQNAAGGEVGTMKRTPVLALAVIATVVAVGGLRAHQPPRFDHLKHASLFPTCTGCHQGAEDPEQPILPDSAACATCHDGRTRPYVAWRRPAEGRPSNLKFAHELVPLMTRETPQGTQTLSCEDCHSAPGGQRMAVRRATPEGCLACHGRGVTQHLAAPDSLCETCHLPLVRAAALRPADIAGFPAPPSHQAPNFVSRAGHGALAKGTAEPVAASCTVCHAREFCVTCHVDAPEQPAIQALGADPRSQAIVVRLAAPASHRASDFLSRHGGMAREDARACATCHTRESCLACHAPSQRVSAALYSGGAGRGEGAHPVRHPPESHRENFTARHPQAAATTPASCAGCHVRTDVGAVAANPVDGADRPRIARDTSATLGLAPAEVDALLAAAARRRGPTAARDRA